MTASSALAVKDTHQWPVPSEPSLKELFPHNVCRLIVDKKRFRSSCVFCLGHAKFDLLKEFPDPKGLLNNTISRSLGISDLSELIQYSCTERAGVKVRTRCVSYISRQSSATKPTRRLLCYFGSCRKQQSPCSGPAKSKKKATPPRRSTQSGLLQLLLV